MKIYFTATYGDISIESNKESKSVVLKTTDLSEGEKNLLKEILKEYNIFPEEGLENKSFVIDNKKVEDVYKFMKKKLKKDRPTLTAIKYADGKIECIEELDKELTEKAETAAVVEKPRRGCPMPTVFKSEIRASAVLKEFLSNKQMTDFNKHLQFVSKGNWSEKPYLVTSRWNEKVTEYGQLYDIVEKRVVCANCLEIPPSEEMLSLKLMIEFKEKEFVGQV